MRLLHGATERDALRQLHGNVFRHELGIQFGLLDVLDVDLDLTPAALLQLFAEHIDFRPLAADDHARARRIDIDDRLAAGALDLDTRNAGTDTGGA